MASRAVAVPGITSTGLRAFLDQGWPFRPAGLASWTPITLAITEPSRMAACVGASSTPLWASRVAFEPIEAANWKSLTALAKSAGDRVSDSPGQIILAASSVLRAPSSLIC